MESLTWASGTGPVPAHRDPPGLMKEDGGSRLRPTGSVDVRLVRYPHVSFLVNEAETS